MSNTGDRVQIDSQVRKHVPTNRAWLAFLFVVLLALWGCESEKKGKPAQPENPNFQLTPDKERLCNDYRLLTLNIQRNHFFSSLIIPREHPEAANSYVRKGRERLWQMLKSTYPVLAPYDEKISSAINQTGDQGCAPEELIFDAMELENQHGTITLPEGFDFSKLLIDGLRAQASVLDPHSEFKPMQNSMLNHRDLNYGFILYPDERIPYGMRLESLAVLGIDENFPPAWQHPLKSGDRIVAVNGRAVKDFVARDLISAFAKAAYDNREIQLTVSRPGLDGEPVSVLLRPKSLAERSGVTSRVLDLKSRIGYVKIDEFFLDQTEKAFHNAVINLNSVFRKEGSALRDRTTIDAMRLLILDLRGCPGGSINPVLSIFNLFSKTTPFLFESHLHTAGQVTLLPYRQFPKAFVYLRETFDVPLVILVDHRTSSSAEVLAKLLQLYGRALIIGEKTFGKASMQLGLRVTDLLRLQDVKGVHPLEGEFWITNTIWYFSDKTTYQLKGIIPDLILQDPAIEVLQKDFRGKYPKAAVSEAMAENVINPEMFGREIVFSPPLLQSESAGSCPAGFDLHDFLKEQKSPIIVDLKTPTGDDFPFNEDRALHTVRQLLRQYLASQPL